MSQNLLHRVFVIFLLFLWTTSCGFTPVYEPGSQSKDTLADISVAPPRGNRANYLFVRELESRIGRNLNGGKRLEHSIRLSEQGLGAFGRERNRVQIVGNVTYTVVSVDDNRSLFRGGVSNFVTFIVEDNITSSVRADSMERLMKILVDQTVTQVMARLSEPANE